MKKLKFIVSIPKMNQNRKPSNRNNPKLKLKTNKPEIQSTDLNFASLKNVLKLSQNYKKKPEILRASLDSLAEDWKAI